MAVYFILNCTCDRCTATVVLYEVDYLPSHCSLTTLHLLCLQSIKWYSCARMLHTFCTHIHSQGSVLFLMPVICIGKLTFTVSIRLSKIHYQAIKFCLTNSSSGTSADLTCCAYEIPFKTFPVYQELLSAQPLLSDEWWKKSFKIKPVSGHFHHITYKIHENLTTGMATVECSYVTVSKSYFIEVWLSLEMGYFFAPTSRFNKEQLICGFPPLAVLKIKIDQRSDL